MNLSLFPKRSSSSTKKMLLVITAKTRTNFLLFKLLNKVSDFLCLFGCANTFGDLAFPSLSLNFFSQYLSLSFRVSPSLTLSLSLSLLLFIQGFDSKSWQKRSTYSKKIIGVISPINSIWLNKSKVSVTGSQRERSFQTGYTANIFLKWFKV